MRARRRNGMREAAYRLPSIVLPVAALLLLSTIAVAPSGPADETALYGEITPGGGYIVPSTGAMCSMGFLAKDEAGATYIMTAGHCVPQKVIGEPLFAVETDELWPVDYLEFDEPPSEPFGEAVFSVHHGTRDWGLIKVYPEAMGVVDPSLKTWTGPSGSAADDTIYLEDAVCHYGWGWVFQYADASRARCGRFAGYYDKGFESGVDVDRFRISGTTVGGDSGSPLIHYSTGKAIGIITGITTYGPGQIIGTAVCTIIASAADAGITLQLWNAPYAPPPMPHNQDLQNERGPEGRLSLFHFEGGEPDQLRYLDYLDLRSEPQRQCA